MKKYIYEISFIADNLHKCKIEQSNEFVYM